jgi:hypothetical protein
MTGDVLKEYLRGAGAPMRELNIDDSRYQHPYDWHEKSRITFTSLKDFNDALERARNYVLKVML